MYHAVKVVHFRRRCVPVCLGVWRVITAPVLEHVLAAFMAIATWWLAAHPAGAQACACHTSRPCTCCPSSREWLPVHSSAPFSSTPNTNTHGMLPVASSMAHTKPPPPFLPVQACVVVHVAGGPAVRPCPAIWYPVCACSVLDLSGAQFMDLDEAPPDPLLGGACAQICVLPLTHAQQYLEGSTRCIVAVHVSCPLQW